jgi:hypothetical protein
MYIVPHLISCEPSSYLDTIGQNIVQLAETAPVLHRCNMTLQTDSSQYICVCAVVYRNHMSLNSFPMLTTRQASLSLKVKQFKCIGTNIYKVNE